MDYQQIDVTPKDDREELKAEIKKLKGCLIYVRDNLVHGNLKHVEMINKVLGGQ